MASESYPNTGHNSGALTELEHERLVHAQSADGVLGHPSDQPVVFADGTGTRLVKIRAGRLALVRGSQWYSGASIINMPSLASNGSGQPRIDLVVLRLDRNDYTVTEAVITGTPGANPVAPSPTANTGATLTWDLPLAQVRVESGATAITADKVTNVAWYLSDDGQILCTPTTRPPHHAGRIIFEPAGSRSYQSNGSTWIRLLEDSGWVNATVASGWSTSPTGYARVRRVGRMVVLAVDIFRTGGNLTSNAVLVGALPSGYEPDVLVLAQGSVNVTGGGACRFAIDTSRQIRIDHYASIATGRAVSVQTTWPQ